MAVADSNKQVRHPRGKHHERHGMSRTPTYISWMCMRARCLDATHTSYKNYGAKGVRICERWLNSFAAFLADMGARPAGHSLDRIDNSKGYQPGNCVWSPRVTQYKNRTLNPRRKNAKLIEHNGESLTVSGWAKRVGVHYHILYNRLADGWSMERALETPATVYKKR